MIVRALLIALAIVVAWAGFQTVRAGRLKAEAVALRAENATLEREATGQAEISTATERHYERETIIREIASQAETEARDAPDATKPLSQERADRLRLNDQRVCDSAPAICGNPDPAAGRSPTLPPAGPAG